MRSEPLSTGTNKRGSRLRPGSASSGEDGRFRSNVPTLQGIKNSAQKTASHQRWVILLTCCATIAVLDLFCGAGVFYQLAVENKAIAAGTLGPSERLINTAVILTLIQASAVKT